MRYLFSILLSLVIFSCSPNNVEKDNMPEKFFKEKNLTGSFALLHNANKSFKIYNLSDYKDSAYIPGTAFNIVNGLIAIENGTITDENSQLAVSDTTTSTLKTAVDKNAPFFDSLSVKTGKDKMQFWLDSLHYGNLKVNNLTDFWNDGSLTITADEQLGLVTGLHFSSLPLQKRTQAAVNGLLHREANSKYTLGYNKGIAPHAGGYVAHINGWIIENKHVYFFSQTTKSADSTSLMQNSETLLRSILKEYGYFEGKK